MDMRRTGGAHYRFFLPKKAVCRYRAKGYLNESQDDGSDRRKGCKQYPSEAPGQPRSVNPKSESQASQVII